MALTTHKLFWLPDRAAICRLDPGADIPDWAWTGTLCSVTRTVDEISIVCDDEKIPNSAGADRGWRVLKVDGPMDLGTVGVLAAITGTLAQAGISLFAISTFETDYLLVKEGSAAKAEEVLRREGHEVERAGN